MKNIINQILDIANNTNGTTKEIKEVSKNKKNEEIDKKLEKKMSTLDDNYLLYTKKYIEGITLSELLEKDKEYLKMLATKANKYRDLTNEFLGKNNISIESL